MYSGTVAYTVYRILELSITTYHQVVNHHGGHEEWNAVPHLVDANAVPHGLDPFLGTCMSTQVGASTCTPTVRYEYIYYVIR